MSLWQQLVVKEKFRFPEVLKNLECVMVTYRLNYDGESKKGVTEIGYGNLPFKATVAGKPTSSKEVQVLTAIC